MEGHGYVPGTPIATFNFNRAYGPPWTVPGRIWRQPYRHLSLAGSPSGVQIAVT